MNKMIAAIFGVLLATSAFAGSTIIGSDGRGGYVGPAEVFQPSTSDKFALRAQRKGVVLYDSGVVASGAAIDTGVLDLTGITEIEVVVDNTAGAAMRDLVWTAYIDDAVTVIDTTVVRKVAFGAPATGSNYAPGRARGYLGPNPPGFTTGVHVLFDSTSGSNATLTTGALLTEDADALDVQLKPSGSLGAGLNFVVSRVLDDGTASGVMIIPNIGSQTDQGFTVAATANVIAPGLGRWMGAAPVAPYRRTQIDQPALGTGITGRLVVSARGRVPGTFAVQMLLPTKGKLTLAAGGSANGRMTVIGR